MTINSNSIYKEHILELYRHPKNFGSLEKPTHKAHEHNSLCGDEIIIEVKVANGKIDEIKFNGQGCAISIAATSMLTEKIKGIEVEKALKLSKEELLDELKIPISYARLKCVLISIDTLKKALEKK